MGELERRGVLSRLWPDPAAEPQLVRMALAVDDSVLDESDVARANYWRHAPAFDRRRASVATWVFTITRNLAVESLRLRRAMPLGPDEFLARRGPSTDPQPVQPAEAAEGTARMRSALQTLPPEQRRALVMAAVYGYTAAEVSEAEPVPLGTAKTRIRTGLLKLRARYASAEGFS